MNALSPVLFNPLPEKTVREMNVTEGVGFLKKGHFSCVNDIALLGNDKKTIERWPKILMKVAEKVIVRDDKTKYSTVSRRNINDVLGRHVETGCYVLNVYRNPEE